MTENKSNIKVKIILAVIMAAALCLLGYEVFSHMGSGKKSAAEETASAKATISAIGNQSKPSAASDLSGTSVTLNSYTVYDLEQVDFRFIIADIHVSSDAAINLSLSHFKTSEGIFLDQVSDYTSKLEAQSLYLGRQNVWFSMISQDTSTDTKVFIPVKDSSLTSITLSNDFQSNQTLSFNLSNPTGKASDLLYQADDVITDGSTYEMTVSEAFDITGMYLYQNVDGEKQEYLLPSTTKVYAFHIQAVSLWGDSIVLDSAQYVTDGTGDTFDAMDASVEALKYSNILGLTISDKDDGYLFFYAFDPDDHPVEYHGVLKLKLKDSDTAITVNVNLN